MHYKHSNPNLYLTRSYLSVTIKINFKRINDG
jgi:hypothetical protein